MSRPFEHCDDLSTLYMRLSTCCLPCLLLRRMHPCVVACSWNGVDCRRRGTVSTVNIGLVCGCLRKIPSSRRVYLCLPTIILPPFPAIEKNAQREWQQGCQRTDSPDVCGWPVATQASPLNQNALTVATVKVEETLNRPLRSTLQRRWTPQTSKAGTSVRSRSTRARC